MQFVIPIVDVFAGPGGLSEGFSSLFSQSGNPVFRLVASFEKDPTAIATLKLRAAVRLAGRDHAEYLRFLRDGDVGHLFASSDISSAYRVAEQHIHELELGEPNRATVSEIIKTRLSSSEDWVLIGGPPCQAYSLAGRSRRAHDESFAEDERHFLYREYLDIIDRHRPAVFVMENVKGLLSARHSGRSMFERIREDLQLGGWYEIRSLVVETDDPQPRDFVIRAEEFGIPQKRHRVILLGVRKDMVREDFMPLSPVGPVTLRSAIGRLPKVRTRLSRTSSEIQSTESAHALGIACAESWLSARDQPFFAHAEVAPKDEDQLGAWLNSSGDVPVSLHEPRSHMALDLARYAFLASVAERGYSPRVDELPQVLVPNHTNISGSATPFRDRFKVQMWGHASSTITSHISKDGHYYIHPDPDQMRSLTVREAARLQTFPDDYFFCGNRTMQYHQVGNAVPPLLAREVAKRVATILGDVP